MFLLKGAKIIKYNFPKKTTIVIDKGNCYLLYETQAGIKRTLVLNCVKIIFVLDSKTFTLMEFIDNFSGCLYLYDVNIVEFNPYSKAAYFYIAMA